MKNWYLLVIALCWMVTATSQEESVTQHPVETFIASLPEAPHIKGEILILYGQVLDVQGNPVPDTVVEIWQTDTNGIYDHPGDYTTSDRNLAFQFYGSSYVDDKGWYAFRTILPGEYTPRPRHIHFKVKQEGRTILTSQFYFSDDIVKVQGEGMFQAVGERSNLLLLQLVTGEQGLLAQGQIVVATNGRRGALPLTPSQAEGPFYPVVAVAEYDSDLTVLP